MRVIFCFGIQSATLRIFSGGASVFWFQNHHKIRIKAFVVSSAVLVIFGIRLSLLNGDESNLYKPRRRRPFGYGLRTLKCNVRVVDSRLLNSRVLVR